jgi:hypothetical protein
MRSVRLDPFSAKLLAIRTGHSRAPVRDPPLLDENPPTATDATDALGLEGESVGTVMEPSLSVHKRAVAPTGCETCQEHAPTSIAELAKEVADLRDRVRSLEDRAFREDHPEMYPVRHQSLSHQ